MNVRKGLLVAISCVSTQMALSSACARMDTSCWMTSELVLVSAGADLYKMYAYMCTYIIDKSYRDSFIIISSLLTYSDIDECEVDNGGCEEMCVNIPGSYHCLCHRGFILQDDSRTCEGIMFNYYHECYNFLSDIVVSPVSP